MIHIGKNSRSRIISKGISAGKSKNSYRGLVSVQIKLWEQEIIHNVILY
jgi:Fe-S cluster assembly protein SufB